MDTSYSGDDIYFHGGSFHTDSWTTNITSGSGNIYFTEECAHGKSISIGGVGEKKSTMTVNQDELDRLTCGSTYFNSLYGDITISGFNHPAMHAQNVAKGFEITAHNIGSTVTFDNSSTTSRNMSVTSLKVSEYYKLK